MMNQINDNALFDRILKDELITPYFQPIYDLTDGTVHGYEALSRGPKNSALFSPIPLFDLAQQEGKLHQLELLCRKKALSKFSKLALEGKLFLNISASLFSSPEHQSEMSLLELDQLGIDKNQIVIELSEQHPYEYTDLTHSRIKGYRDIGFQIAIDDLGVGYSGLQLWSELQPNIVKIDRHFIQNIDTDKIKQEFIRAMICIAERTNCTVIAEGIETKQELAFLIKMGVTLGQGYFLGHPTDSPKFATNPDLAKQTKKPSQFNEENSESVQSLCRPTPYLHENSVLDDASKHFKKHKELTVIPILDHQHCPIGVIRRHQLHEIFSTPYGRALYEQKPVTQLLTSNVLVVESSISLATVSTLITDQEADVLNNEIIIVRNGKYSGTGHLKDLLKRITELKIQNATYSNPLTLLPGNVPIHKEVSRRLLADKDFHVAYFDLNDFKPFNDFFGYAKGDAVIQLVGSLIKDFVSPENNFIGHIGGDDFVVIFGDTDWKPQCEAILSAFAQEISDFYSPETLQEGGVWTKNREGEMRFHAILSLAIGVIKTSARQCSNHHQVAEMAAHAKKSAKEYEGNYVHLLPSNFLEIAE
ncbi:GGDEF domain-containing protein [Marinomonas sp. 2405UD66-6]|uniref:GGDEF domain-containing protein n=1 Tax=Marinomonas sp. 2405UD66-6 TaxID=3391834 RepID=UPI0039C8FE24